MAWRVTEILVGYVRLTVVADPYRKVMKELVERRVLLWDVESQKAGDYTFCVGVRDLSATIRSARRNRVKLRFTKKVGLPFWLWRAQRRKVFVGGAVFFILALYTLSGFIWHIRIDGTDQPEAVMAALQKLNIRPGTWLYQVMDQDSIQLALLDKLPDISWVGVRISGTSMYIHVVLRVAPSPPLKKGPQNIVARVPGIIANVLADYGQPTVKPGQYVTPGMVLISGELEDGQSVFASGRVHAIVWYRTDVTLPQETTVSTLTGEQVVHDYIVIAGMQIPVWGFSHPPYPHQTVVQKDTPLVIANREFPFAWRVDTVYEAKPIKERLSPDKLIQRGLSFAARDVISHTKGDDAKVLRQNILQKNLEHGKLYMTVWTEVIENIGRPEPIVPKPVSVQPPAKG